MGVCSTLLHIKISNLSCQLHLPSLAMLWIRHCNSVCRPLLQVPRTLNGYALRKSIPLQIQLNKTLGFDLTKRIILVQGYSTESRCVYHIEFENGILVLYQNR